MALFIRLLALPAALRRAAIYRALFSLTLPFAILSRCYLFVLFCFSLHLFSYFLSVCAHVCLLGTIKGCLIPARSSVAGGSNLLALWESEAKFLPFLFYFIWGFCCFCFFWQTKVLVMQTLFFLTFSGYWAKASLLQCMLSTLDKKTRNSWSSGSIFWEVNSAWSYSQQLLILASWG